MKSSLEKNIGPVCDSSKKYMDVDSSSQNEEVQDSVTEPSVANSENHKSAAIWSGIWPLDLSVFGNFSSSCSKSESTDCVGDCSSSSSSSGRGKSVGSNYYEGCRAAVRRVMMNGGSMGRILGFSRAGISVSKSDIWLLGVSYRIAKECDDPNALDPTQSEGFAAFVEDFSSRILVTYRKGFAPIGDTKYTSDVNWGCMIRSSQMLVAQAFLVHKLGRSWRKSPDKSLDESYVEILHLFGDAEESACSIHNLLHAGKAYGLAPGSWVGPYAVCRSWECLVRSKREESFNGILSSMMAIYTVSGDEDGERGGAPVICIEDISNHCSEFSGGQVEWSPILLMVPLVLGLEKVNPRYLPLLSATFTFPQSVGILGGRPGASTYLVGVQDEKAFYLDPHDVQQAVDIKSNNLDVDTSSYHCIVVNHIPLDSIDPSLALGFYCRDRSDFDDFCVRALDLIDQSNGAPLFTISDTRSSTRIACHHIASKNSANEPQDYDPTIDLASGATENCAQEDEWQVL